ncbi:putative quinol monooxygenase [Virgibacillus halodenitrificans]|uniref:putative quinol monooxygenase n=1 Tax=Virgibacillus halodenitrificans TaxID=1482 RepID=UPI001F2233DB|nr:antibiotic biosynthesis monooxygenase [Virgibacillus halodenitrificans]
MSKFGLYNMFTAVKGKRDSLAKLLLEASKSMEKVDECELYVVSLADDNASAIYVYEVWSSKEAHQDSLLMETSQQLIRDAKPILAGVEKLGTSIPIGGKGVSTSQHHSI